MLFDDHKYKPPVLVQRWRNPPYPKGYRKVWEVFDDEDLVEWFAQDLSFNDAIWYLAILEMEDTVAQEKVGFKTELFRRVEPYAESTEGQYKWKKMTLEKKGLLERFMPKVKNPSNSKGYLIGTWKVEKLRPRSMEWEMSQKFNTDRRIREDG